MPYNIQQQNINSHLHYHAVGQSLMTVHLTYLGVTVSVVEGHDLLMDLLLPVHCLRLPPILRETSTVNKTGVVVVEPVQVQRCLVEEGVVLPHEFTSHLYRAGGRRHDHCVHPQKVT